MPSLESCKLTVCQGMDPQQHQIVHLRYSSQGIEDGRHLYRKLNRHPGDVQEAHWVLKQLEFGNSVQTGGSRLGVMVASAAEVPHKRILS